MFGKTFSFWRRLMGLEEPQRPAKTADAQQDDRRVWVRYPAELMTTFRPATHDDHARLSALVRDVSQGGINLLSDKRLEPGQLLSIELPRSGTETHQVLACIVRVEKSEGKWSLGCVFSSELSDDELQSLGARRSLAASSDQRKFIRYACDIKAQFEAVADDSGRHDAKVLNVSASGVALMVEREVEPGALLNVTLHSATGSASRTILCCVVHVASQEAGTWALGCNFIRQLTEDDLQALL